VKYTPAEMLSGKEKTFRITNTFSLKDSEFVFFEIEVQIGTIADPKMLFFREGFMIQLLFLMKCVIGKGNREFACLILDSVAV